MKLFLDANVIFSAAHRSEGRSQSLVALARAGACDLVTSAHALEEAARNLRLKSSGFETRLEGLTRLSKVVAEAPAVLVAWATGHGLPPNDAPILAAAIHAQADLLVTGDGRDFGHLFDQVLRATRIVTPAKALDIVLKAAGV